MTTRSRPVDVGAFSEPPPMRVGFVVSLKQGSEMRGVVLCIPGIGP